MSVFEDSAGAPHEAINRNGILAGSPTAKKPSPRVESLAYLSLTILSAHLPSSGRRTPRASTLTVYRFRPPVAGSGLEAPGRRQDSTDPMFTTRAEAWPARIDTLLRGCALAELVRRSNLSTVWRSLRAVVRSTGGY